MEKDKTYKIRINLNGRDLVYTGTIITTDSNFITFKDKFGNVLSYNKNVIISYEEINKW
jgi:hypothetical protein